VTMPIQPSSRCSLNSATLGVDWAHSNAVVIEPVTGDRIVSARHQGAVVRFGADDTIKWILADPGGWGPTWTDALLTPVGEPFEWPHHQHAPMLHPSGDGRLVAADRRLFPFGSLLTVPGYAGGQVVPVLDRGGAIKGSRLDVLYPTHQVARRWGVRHLDVTVWEYADGRPIGYRRPRGR